VNEKLSQRISGKMYGRPSHTWKDYIKVNLKEIMFEGLYWTYVIQY